MPTSGKGNFFATGHMARRDDAMSHKQQAKPMGGMKDSEQFAGKGGGEHDHAPAHTVHIHNFGGKFHTVGHHEDGSHHMEHGSMEEAHSASKECMGGEKNPDGGNQGEDITENQDGGDTGSSWMGGQ